jgi:hypothetical protein
MPPWVTTHTTITAAMLQWEQATALRARNRNSSCFSQAFSASLAASCLLWLGAGDFAAAPTTFPAPVIPGWHGLPKLPYWCTPQLRASRTAVLGLPDAEQTVGTTLVRLVHDTVQSDPVSSPRQHLQRIHTIDPRVSPVPVLLARQLAAWPTSLPGDASEPIEFGTCLPTQCFSA